MTANQIAYAKYLEDKQHNRATESHNINVLTENKRHNLATESQGQQSIDENKRHNLATEQHASNALAEDMRHNLVTERETHRSNVAKEQETHRSNVAKETETSRHNVATEGISKQQVSLGFSQLAETVRSNKADEAIDTNKLTETQRHNEATESLTDYSNKTHRGDVIAKNVISGANAIVNAVDKLNPMGAVASAFSKLVPSTK